MRKNIDSGKSDRIDHVEIVGLAADESDFGHGDERERLFFKEDYEGRKSLVLSGRPSAVWVREFNRLTQVKPKASYASRWNSVSLQPNKKRLYFIAKNNWLHSHLTDLKNLFDSINANLLDRNTTQESIILPNEPLVSKRERVEKFMSRIKVVSVI